MPSSGRPVPTALEYRRTRSKPLRGLERRDLAAVNRLMFREAKGVQRQCKQKFSKKEPEGN
jgi:hypothetical protein